MDEIGVGYDENRPTSGTGYTGANTKRAVTTLTPVTILQLLQAEQPSPEESFRIDGREITQVTFVAQIMKVSLREVNFTLELDDGTSRIEAKVWSTSSEDSADDAFLEEKKAMWREGVYVRVHGSVKSFREKKVVHTVNVRVIDDFNEITYHFLEAIAVHLENTRGSSFKQEFTHSSSSSSSHHPNHTQTETPPTGDPTLDRICQIIHQSSGEAGSHILDIHRLMKLNGSEMSLDDLKRCLKVLIDRYIAFTTTDELHFQLA